MSGEFPHSMAASSTAEDLSVNCHRSSSVSNTAGMGIVLSTTNWAPYSSKVLDRNSVVVPKGFDLPRTRAGAASPVRKDVVGEKLDTNLYDIEVKEWNISGHDLRAVDFTIALKRKLHGLTNICSFRE